MSDQTSGLLGKIGEYEGQLARDPRSKVFIPLAETYRRLGMLDDALTTIRRGLQLHPGLSEARIVAARILAQRGELGEARDLFQEVVAADPDNLLALKGLARVLLLLEQPQEASRAIRRLLQLQPSDPDVAKLKAQCQEQLAQAMKSEAERHDSPIKTATLAEIYVKQGLLQEAAQVYEEILQTNPGNAEVRSRLEAVQARLRSSAPSPAASPVPTAADLPGSAAVAPAVADSAPPNQAQRLLPIFENWLKAIRQRRDHVL